MTSSNMQPVHRLMTQLDELQNPLTNQRPLARDGKLHIELSGGGAQQLQASDPAFLRQLLTRYPGGVYVLVQTAKTD